LNFRNWRGFRPCEAHAIDVANAEIAAIAREGGRTSQIDSKENFCFAHGGHKANSLTRLPGQDPIGRRIETTCSGRDHCRRGQSLIFLRFWRSGLGGQRDLKDGASRLVCVSPQPTPRGRRRWTGRSTGPAPLLAAEGKKGACPRVALSLSTPAPQQASISHFSRGRKSPWLWLFCTKPLELKLRLRQDDNNHSYPHPDQRRDQQRRRGEAVPPSASKPATGKTPERG